MRVRSFLTFCALTLAVVAATIVVVGRQEAPHSTLGSVGPVFPGLVDRLGEVAAVVVQSKGGTLTLRRIDGGWGLAERGNYPVEPDAVPQLARSLVQLDKVEAKTVDPDRWARLGVENVDAPDAKSTEVTLQTAGGAPVASLIVGNPAADGGTEGATYVRLPGDPQSWLARGTINVHTEAKDWVVRRLMDIPAADIREIRIVHPDKSTVTVVRTGEGAAPGSGTFRLAEVPPAKLKLKRPDGIDSMTGALADVMLDDLADAADVSFPADKTLRVKVTRTDGVVVAFDLVEQHNQRWLRFVESAAPASLPAAGRTLAFRVPTWKFSPLERKLSEIIETAP